VELAGSVPPNHWGDSRVVELICIGMQKCTLYDMKQRKLRAVVYMNE